MAYAGQIQWSWVNAPQPLCVAPDDATTMCQLRGGTAYAGGPVYWTLMGQACGNGNTSLSGTHNCTAPYVNSAGRCGQICYGTLMYSGELLSAASCSIQGNDALYTCQFAGSCQVTVYNDPFEAFVPSSACVGSGGGSGSTLAISVSPALRTINQGDTTTYTVDIYNQNTGTLNLSLAGCPSNATCTFSNSAPTFTSATTDDSLTTTLTVVSTNSTPVNLYNLTVSGVTGATSQTAVPVQLQVNSRPPTDPTNPSGVPSTTTGSSASCGTVNLSWGASTGGSGAITYRILRHTSNSAALATQITSGISGTTYSNTSLPASTSYYYWVQAVAGSQTSNLVPFGMITVPPCATAGSAPVVTVTANPTSGTAPMASTITWTTTNSPSSCTASGAWSGAKTASGGSQSVTSIPAGTNTFSLSCTNAFGTSAGSVVVTATAANTGAPTVSVTASPTSGSAGMSTTVTWTTTNSPTSCTAFDDWSGSKAVGGGSQVISGLTNGVKNYSIQCSNANGSSVSTATVTVGSSGGAPTATISASPSTVTTGGSTTVVWSSTNATGCTASSNNGSWSGAKAASGSEKVYNLNSDTTFTVNCNTGSTYSGPVSTTVMVVPTSPQCGWAGFPGYAWGPIGNVPIGSTFQFNCDSGVGQYLPTVPPKDVNGNCTFANWNGTTAVYNCIAGDPYVHPTYSYRDWLTCGWSNVPSAPYCQAGAFVYYGNAYDPIVPVITITPSSGSGPFTVSWNVTGGATECTASGGYAPSWSGSKNPTSGSESGKVIPSGTYTYLLSCSDANPLYQRYGTGSATLTVSGGTTSYSLNVTKTIGGSVKSADNFINCGTTCAKSYAQGTAVTLTATPDSTQWKFAGWSGDCSGNGVCNLIMNATKNVKALFITKPLIYQEF
ncbi:MAG: trimeric autotransporter adhesin [Patescibacteria group bacterium]|nr:trimeric autotransporter adhesin [Patescibacteria group bacterium]